MKKTSIVLNVILAVLAGVLIFKVANTDEPQGNAAYDNIMTRCSVRAYDSERTVPDGEQAGVGFCGDYEA